MNEFEFKSHKKSKKNAMAHVVAANTKKRLHNFAIKAIVQDNLPFGVFHKKGNNKDLEAIDNYLKNRS